MSAFDYKLSTITKYRAGTTEDPYVPITESKKIDQQQIQLSEIPVIRNRVNIAGFVELQEVPSIGLSGNQYIVDYNEGIIQFSPSQEGVTVPCVYQGRGNHYISAHRVWTSQNNGEVTESLGDIITAGNTAIANLGQVTQAITDANAATVAANTAAGSATTAASSANTTNTSIQSAEASRITAEGTRISSESTRVTQESSRVSAESARATSETGRVSAESSRVTAEGNRVTAETGRTGSESARVTAEGNRSTAETSRGSAETSRVSAESIRVTDETARGTSETGRASAETTRITNETDRGTAESSRATAEANRVSAESSRVSIESSRVSAETTRGTNESTRQGNESTRQSQESTRQSGFTAYTTTETYDNTHNYIPLNKVRHNGSTYECILASTGNLPTNPTYWAPVALKGTDGSGAGTVLSVASANADISVASPNDNPVLTLNSGIGANQIGKRNASGDLPGNITGNAETVTTNANLTGQVTSVGNITTIASGIDATKIANGTVTNTEFQYLDGVTSAIQTQLDAKLPSASYTAADVLTKIKTVDGTGSGLDADTVKGYVPFNKAGDTFGRAVVTQPQLKDYSEKLTTNAATTGAIALDIANGNVFDCTLTGATILTFSNPAPTGQACSFTLFLRQGATAQTVAWPASVVWNGDVAPDLTNVSKTIVLTFSTVNGGARWYGFLAGNNFVT